MQRRITPINFSVITLTSRSCPVHGLEAAGAKSAAFLSIATPRNGQAHFFQDMANGTCLCINTNNTFQLIDPSGYSTGIVWAQQMVFEKHEVTVWHQDQRFSFTCHANVRSGFCFGWLIDRLHSKSYRVLDPGRHG